MDKERKKLVKATLAEYPSLANLLQTDPNLYFGEIFDYLEVIKDLTKQEKTHDRFEYIDLYSHPFRLKVAALLIQDKPLDYPLLRQAVAQLLINQSKEQWKRFTPKAKQGPVKSDQSNLEHTLLIAYFLKREGYNARQISQLFKHGRISKMKASSLKRKLREFKKENAEAVVSWDIDKKFLSFLLDKCQFLEKSFQLKKKYGIKELLVIHNNTRGHFCPISESSKKFFIEANKRLNYKK